LEDQHRRELIERYIAAYNAFDVDGMLAVMSDDLVFRNVSNGETTMEIEGKCVFRRCRSVIPADADRPFRAMPITCSS